MLNPYKEIINLLKINNIPYKETEHEPVYTSEQAAKVRGISISQGAKSLLLKCGDDFILVVLPGDRKLDSKKLKNLLKIKWVVKSGLATPLAILLDCQLMLIIPYLKTI